MYIMEDHREDWLITNCASSLNKVFIIIIIIIINTKEKHHTKRNYFTEMFHQNN